MTSNRGNVYGGAPIEQPKYNILENIYMVYELNKKNIFCGFWGRSFE